MNQWYMKTSLSRSSMQYESGKSGAIVSANDCLNWSAIDDDPAGAATNMISNTPTAEAKTAANRSTSARDERGAPRLARIALR
jgi:hypothetical protein